MTLEKFLTTKTTDEPYRDLGIDKAFSPEVEQKLRTSALKDEYRRIRKQMVDNGEPVPSRKQIKADLRKKFTVEGLPLLSWIQLIMLVWKIWRELRATRRTA